MRVIILRACLLFSLVISCNKGNNPEELTGQIEDYTGRLDGCGYLIILDNGERLEPVTNSSGKVLLAGKRIAIRYKIKPAVSICMAGQGIEIISLRYL